MTIAKDKGWKYELGISELEPPNLFTNPSQFLGPSTVAQAHAMRRAFEEMKLSGILCVQKLPVVYFREVSRISAEGVRDLHRRFWSQGLAPMLALITPTEVFIYSGLILPAQEGQEVNDNHRLITRLNRVAQAAEIRELILSLRSGEFFHAHASSFDPSQRVDRQLLRNLKSTRQEMVRLSGPTLDPKMLDAILCRLIFTCYLFDRQIIDARYLRSAGIQTAKNLQDILALPKHEARRDLYKLFKQLGDDFNGDLFQDDLTAEQQAVTYEHLDTLDRLLRGADVSTGQGSFWPYDFSVIPIETISAIYEHFLREDDKNCGAFYTPRFLAEIVLDLALEGLDSLLAKRFLDPACGSGIFLVGLFNRLAEEWKHQNPTARYDGRASGLMVILRDNLFGVDLNATACRITAFSLYLAFLDQLSPPDIQKLQSKGKMLPRLVFKDRDISQGTSGKTIFCGDFFKAAAPIPSNFHVVIGNPPWKSETDDHAPYVRWCAERKLPLPDRQSAVAFAWKAPQHLLDGGKSCLILPHGVLFNYGPVSLRFQKAWLSAHAVDVILNLADFQRFLFEHAENPALVIRFRKDLPSGSESVIRYLSPKMDWGIGKAELVSLYPEDQTYIVQQRVIAELQANTVPLVWKEHFWGTPRDWKLLDRLRLFPTLDEIVGHGKPARWFVAQGFKEPGPSDGPNDRKQVTLPTRNLIEATSPGFALFLLESDCDRLPSATLTVRARSNTTTEVYRGPHVLITNGFKVAFADFDTAFRQSVRAVKGPRADAKLLVFLSAYLNSPLARYYLFHTASNIGIERSTAEANDVLRLPFPLPEDAPAGARAVELIDRANTVYQRAVRQVSQPLADRSEIVRTCKDELSEFVYEYFDIDDNERMLVEDSNEILLRSVRRKKLTESIPTLQTSTVEFREQYESVLCSAINDWADDGPYEIRSSIETSPTSGIAVVVLARFKRGSKSPKSLPTNGGFLPVFERLQQAFKKGLGTIELLKGVKVFDRDILYILKPLSQRFWTRTAALNDADDIAAAILSRSIRERA